MKMKDIKGKSISELEKSLAVKQEELRTFRFEMSGSKIKNVNAGKSIRLAIARIRTELTLAQSK
ncbi:MAG: 50S ribosomal protein L29 [Candidatus Taylorbacteria bacterium]|nr:50S ribosomal protein L29 [Candidatus Taylorbacteria bacterium]